MIRTLFCLPLLLLVLATTVAAQEEQASAALQLERLTKSVDTQDGLSEVPVAGSFSTKSR